MSLLPTLGSWVDAGSGVLLLALGLWIASRRPRLRANLLLGLFAITMGLGFLLLNLLSPDDPLKLVTFAAGWSLNAVAAALLVLLSLRFPRPIRRSDRRLVVVPVLLFLVQFAAIFEPFPVTRFFETGSAGDTAARIGLFSLLASFYFALALLALRYHDSEDDVPRRQIALMSAGLLMYPSLAAGFGTAVSEPLVKVVALFPVLVLTGLWLRNARGPPSRRTRTARNLALLFPALALVGVVATFVLGSDMPDMGPMGLARTLTVLILAYAILRHQLLGMDVRVRWTIKQSTVAAVFITVFFVVSEVAQELFATEGEMGSFIGIAAAAVLVFALAPIQRFAERVATTAMPDVKPVGEMTDDERARAYLAAARQAWADGSVSRDERLMLDRLRESLGLAPEQTTRLESQAAKETAPA